MIDAAVHPTDLQHAAPSYTAAAGPLHEPIGTYTGATATRAARRRVKRLGGNAKRAASRRAWLRLFSALAPSRTALSVLAAEILSVIDLRDCIGVDSSLDARSVSSDSACSL